ncbi:MAG: heavy metal translocating P-type ATPase [Thermoanaerobaculia bacterium]|nr:heavy metal translocating P-type ATPase [Thermoanaerobaculia bacterium]
MTRSHRRYPEDDPPPLPRPGRRESRIAAGALVAIAAHLALRWSAPGLPPWSGFAVRDLPLLAALVLGGAPLVLTLLRQALRREFGSDLLAGISIVTAVALGEYLAGALVVLMLSGGQALEGYAVRSASSVLEALARRMPATAHRRDDGRIADVAVDALAVGDVVEIFPHEISPVDGEVIEGHGVMDESYLTGEPYKIAKTPGSTVLSGAVNGDSVIAVRATARAVDSRYAKILAVMRESEQKRPRLRRLGDQLGAVYTPVAVVFALGAWLASGEPVRFLAVLVVATPCPLLIGIPVAIIGSISLAAKRGIVVRDPAVLERVDRCRVAIFDKTGTLTYGTPEVTAIVALPGFDEVDVLADAATLERYSRHPLAAAVVAAANARGAVVREASAIAEPPGAGLRGTVGGRQVEITSRRRAAVTDADGAARLPPSAGGMECAVLVDGRLAALLQFRDTPRREGAGFVRHLGPRHRFERLLLVSGDRESEVRYVADLVGITEVHHSQSPEQKLALVRAETARAPTLFLGDGINDAPALAAATVGIAVGANSDVTSEAAGAVILDSSLERADVFLHISRRMRSIALQSAVGGMALSLAGMGLAAAGLLTPVAGAVTQEVIDVAAVLNALRAAWPPRQLTDF